ncbi:hypothetical protein GCM10010909_16390 [Acidocella aquatica]|uniref:Photosynthesis system II assembly factor Ycf48/Hcf136-like domain-containing protein n=2 Tax=Acidocella aquatica TaxID=1922313 RepID=A0ABQ6AA05_9PROT|nr:hypothetical protein GCM10010909_16390 [Acidocella aquatica]
MVRASTDVLALDEPAIHVLKPSGVFLDALDNAGDRIVAGGEHGVIIYSNNDGVSWTQASVPVDVTVTGFAFADGQHGWAVGNSGVILATSDGGKDWTIQLNGFQADQLMMQAAQQAVADNNPSVGTPMAVDRAQHLQERGASTPFLCALALSPRDVIAFGAYRMTMRSDNGGATWQDASLDVGDSLSHNLYGAAVIGGDIYVVGETGLVFRSSDSAKSFPQVAKAANATLFGVTGTAKGNVVAYGVAGTLVRSIDRGQSWSQIAMPGTADLTDGILLSSGNLLITGADGGVYESADDGMTYQAANRHMPMAVFAVAQAADGRLVFAGSRGIMTGNIQQLGLK